MGESGDYSAGMPSDPPTDAEILSAIKTAIYDNTVRGATSVTIGGRSLAGLSLLQLEDMRTKYERRVAITANGSRARVVKFRETG